MEYNSDDLNQLKTLWKAVEAETTESQFLIPDGPQFPLGTVPIPISSTARHRAARTANLCHNIDFKETMRRNLLATIAVHDYLRLQGYLPDLGASDCWNPILGRTGEVADLVVSQVGRFECCAIDPGQSTCPVPSEGQFGRAGYVMVEIDAEEHWGWLLGFVPSRDEINPIKTLNREALHSMDEFGHHLYRLWLLWHILQERSEPWDVELRAEMVALLERNYRTHNAARRPMQAAAEIQQIEWAGTINEQNNLAGSELWQFLRGVFDQLENALATEAKADKGRLVNLGQWLNNRIEKSRIRLEELTPAFKQLDNQIKEEWQNLEALFSAEELTPAFRMRSTSVRGKLIRLTTEIIQQTIVLVVQLNPKSEKDTNIIVEVRPQSGQLYLPETLQVRVLDDQQKAVMEAIASSTNRNIQFDFDVASGEHFSMQMVLGGTSVTEEFVM